MSAVEWDVKRLGDLCEIKPPKSEAKKRVRANEKVSFVPMNDLGQGEKHFEPKDERTLAEVAGSYIYFADNDVLLAKITPCFENGKLGIANRLTNGIGFGSSEFIVMRSNGTIAPEYLFHFLSRQAFRNEGARVMSGAVGHKRVPKEFIENYPIPLPPLPEQERIVAIPDEAFEGIVVATGHAECNLHNARELFQSVLQSTFEQKGDDWEEMTVGEATGGVSTGPFGSLLHKKDYVENGIPLVNPAHITDTGIVPDRRKTVSPETAKRLSAYIMTEGDIVFGRRGEMGRCAVITSNEHGWLCGTGSFFIEPSGKIDPRFLVGYLRSDRCREMLEKIAGGAVMKNLSNTDLSKFPIPVPPSDQQKAIVQKLDALAAETRRLEAVYERKLAALAELKQSLLQRAFSGQL